MNSRFRINVISIVTLAILWEIAGRTLDSVLIPPLSKIGSAWLRLLLSGKLLSNLVMSLGTLAAGFFLGGWFTGARAGAAPILHAVGIGLFSLVAWLLVNLVLGGATGAAEWRSLPATLTAGLLRAHVGRRSHGQAGLGE